MGRGTKKRRAGEMEVAGGDATSPTGTCADGVAKGPSSRAMRSARRASTTTPDTKKPRKADEEPTTAPEPKAGISLVAVAAAPEPSASVSEASDAESEDIYASDADPIYDESEDENNDADGEGRKEADCMDEAGRKAQQEELVSEVSGLLGLPSSQAFLLLRCFKWNEEQLLERYMEDAEAACKEAGIPLPGQEARKEALHAQQADNFECGICRDAGPAQASSLDCGHAYCDTCWGMYLGMKIVEGETRVKCPYDKCHLRATDELIRSVCPADVIAKYDDFVQQSMVDSGAHSVWCPFPDCGLSVDTGGGNKFVTCQRGHNFCTGCLMETHAPASCEIVKVWKKKCEDDSETCNWLNANTQDCPMCQCIIEKNGGCNHMTCKKCKHEFCWVCMGSWASHTDFYSCNRYNPDNKTDKEKGKAASRAELERYLFYFTRFNNHDNSRKLEAKTRQAAVEKMERIQQQEGEAGKTVIWGDVQFVGEATENLMRCRLVLKWTYVLAWHLPDGSQKKELFCFLQQDLESKTERLSELLERDPAILIGKDVKAEVLALSGVAAASRKKLLHGCDCEVLVEEAGEAGPAGGGGEGDTPAAGKEAAAEEGAAAGGEAGGAEAGGGAVAGTAAGGSRAAAAT